MNKRRRRIYIENYVVNILVVLFLSVALSGIGILLSDVADMENVKRYIESPLLFAFNTIPLLLVMLLLFHATRRHWVSFGAGGGLFVLMHIINRFMMQLREEPFTPADLMLGTEAANVVRLSELPFTPLIIFSLVFWMLMSALLFFFVESRKYRWSVKAAGAVAAIALFAVSHAGIYSNTGLYNSFKVTGSIYSAVNRFKSRGFMYSFLVRLSTFQSIKPENYSKEEAARILSEFEAPPYTVNNGAYPHIIAVMGEAFYDIDRIEGIEFNKGFDPLANFNRIAEQAYTGRIVTNVFGGGTANTEFAFLTGHSMPIVPDMSSPYTLYLRRNTFSLARVLDKAGYGTMAFHPGDSWFYNRSNVYNYFGFHKEYFKKDMDIDNVEINYGYISDTDTAEFALDRFNEHLLAKPGAPFFDFVVNIDNHGPYSKKDIGNPEILKRTDTMDESTYNNLNNYVNGLMRCDRALGYFVDFVRGMDEPVVFLFFSDHLPALGESSSGYKALGFSIGRDGGLDAYLNQYETPYFIWCNRAAEKLLKDSGITPLKGSAPLISPNYLASELLEYIGINGGNYFNYLSELKRSLPVITDRFYSEDGEFTESLSEKSMRKIDQYRKLQYYMMMEKEAVN